MNHFSDNNSGIIELEVFKEETSVVVSKLKRMNNQRTEGGIVGIISIRVGKYMRIPICRALSIHIRASK